MATVNEKMTAIADAIRAKTGGTEPLTLDGMATAITGIETGGNTDEAYNQGLEAGKQAEYDRFWDAYQLNGKRNYYVGAFAGGGWNAETFKPKYPITLGNYTAAIDFAFYSFNHNSHSTSGAKYNSPLDMTELSKIIDFSLAKRANNTFQDARIINLTVDFSNCVSLASTFANSNSGYIDGLTLKVSDKCTSFSNTFGQCYDLKTLTMADGSVIAANLSLSVCPLTHDSIMSVINALKDFTGTSTTRTLTLGTTNLAKLTDAEKAIATQKGWSLV